MEPHDWNCNCDNCAFDRVQSRERAERVMRDDAIAAAERAVIEKAEAWLEDAYGSGSSLFVDGALADAVLALRSARAAQSQEASRG